MAERKLFLLDGHALVYRAHYAFINRPLVNSKGMNVSAISGFTRALWDVIKKQQPTHLAVSFDINGMNTFRHEKFPEYKANRDEQPEDIEKAFPYIRRILRGMNIPIIEMDGYEADDVIGTVAKQAEKENFEVYMMTPDKDFGQLVSDNIFLFKPGYKGGDPDKLGVPEVLAKWGIERVEQVIDMLGLQGDKVDNIPGVPGIGPKKAQKLLALYDSVEGIIEHVEEMKGKDKERMIEFADQAILSKDLATIDINVPIQFDEEKYRIEGMDKEQLAEIFKELEFRGIARSILGADADVPPPPPKPGQQQSLFGDAPAAAAPAQPKFKAPPAHSVADFNIENTEHDYQLIDTPEKRAELIQYLSGFKSICLDTETTSIDANEAQLVGMSFAVEKGKAFYVPVPSKQSVAQDIVNEFKALLENPDIEKIGQNIKYDAIVLRWYGIRLGGRFFDTMIAHYLIEPELRHNMDYLAVSYLKYKPVSIETLIGKGKNALNMRDVPVEKVLDYAAEDADVTLQLKEVLEPLLEKENLKDLYWSIEEPLINVLVDIEYNGIRVDSDFLENYSEELQGKIEQLEASIYEQAGQKFNIGSPKQVGEILFDKLKIPYRWRKTKSGQYSTNEEKLTELSVDNPVISDILKYRGLSKLKSTYVDALPKLINSKTGRIHSSFNQALAATGRLSSSNPNLQNIPIRTPEGAQIRKAFVPRSEDFILLAADYSQIELRIIAEISKEQAMLEAFQEGKDIHSSTAARVFDVPFEEVDKEQRYRAKTVNFSIIYGAGAQNLSRQLNIKRTEASELIKNYFAGYPGLKEYMDNMVAEARENGYVTTLMGRRRHLRDIDSRSSVVRSHAERNAINTPIQGTAADMIKIAMINIHKEMEARQLKSKMILQVHDELVFDVHKDEMDALKPMIEEKMKSAIDNLAVPIVVGMDTGENWLEAH